MSSPPATASASLVNPRDEDDLMDEVTITTFAPPAPPPFTPGTIPRSLSGGHGMNMNSRPGTPGYDDRSLTTPTQFALNWDNHDTGPSSGSSTPIPIPLNPSIPPTSLKKRKIKMPPKPTPPPPKRQVHIHIPSGNHSPIPSPAASPTSTTTTTRSIQHPRVGAVQQHPPPVISPRQISNAPPVHTRRRHTTQVTPTMTTRSSARTSIPSIQTNGSISTHSSPSPPSSPSPSASPIPFARPINKSATILHAAPTPIRVAATVPPTSSSSTIKRPLPLCNTNPFLPVPSPSPHQRHIHDAQSTLSALGLPLEFADIVVAAKPAVSRSGSTDSSPSTSPSSSITTLPSRSSRAPSPTTLSGYTYYDANHGFADHSYSYLVNEFKEIKEIGSGSFSTVFLCRKRMDGCLYAVKACKNAIRGTSHMHKEFREVYALSSLEAHPNIVRYYNSWVENSLLHLQFEYCSKGSLGSRARSGYYFHESEIRTILTHMTLAIQHIHTCGLVHLDIKPDNILISAKNVYKLADFGLAVPLHQNTTGGYSTDVVDGDSAYLPNEFLLDDHSNLPSADVFSLGLTIYQLYLGRPLTHNGPEFHDIREGRLETFPHERITMQFQSLIARMLSKNSYQRPTPTTILHELSLLPPPASTSPPQSDTTLYNPEE